MSDWEASDFKIMLLLLMRHGIAEELDDAVPANEDFARPLSANGRKKTARAAAGLTKLVPRVAFIASSPKLRARQTAQLARDGWGRAAPPIVEWPELLEDENFAPLHRRLRALDSANAEASAEGAVLLVGHDPNLSHFARWLLDGDAAVFDWNWKKAGVLALEINFRGAPSIVQWFMPPKVLRALDK